MVNRKHGNNAAQSGFNRRIILQQDYEPSTNNDNEQWENDDLLDKNLETEDDNTKNTDENDNNEYESTDETDFNSYPHRFKGE